MSKIVVTLQTRNKLKKMGVYTRRTSLVSFSKYFVPQIYFIQRNLVYMEHSEYFKYVGIHGYTTIQQDLLPIN